MNDFKEMNELPDIEGVGSAYNPEKMMQVRQMTRAAIHKIASQIKPGMVEEDAIEMAKDILAESHMARGWHDVYVRFGQNTIKTFGAASDPGVVLGAEDIFLIDIGPVFEQWEGDGGDTFVVGQNTEMTRCANDAREIFHLVRRQWLDEKTAGKALYLFAEIEAEKRGWKLNMDLSGHRISDFPHAAIHEGSLAEVNFYPAQMLWVLEIHIRHPSKPLGAFYEDMLLEDEHFN